MMHATGDVSDGACIRREEDIWSESPAWRTVRVSVSTVSAWTAFWCMCVSEDGAARTKGCAQGA